MRWRGWILPAVLVILAIGVYRSALTAPLTSDARFLTVQNAFVRDPGGITQFWTADFFAGAVTHGVPYRSGYYRPIVNTAFWAEFRVFGDSAFGYHVMQVLLHVVNALLVSILVARLFNDRRAGGVAALLFVVHPVHAFAATEIAARADVLFPTFYLLGILAFDSAITDSDRRRTVWKMGLVAVCYAFTVLSKEMGITLPAVLVLVVLLRHVRDRLPIRVVTWTIPLFALMGLYVLWRFVILDLDPPEVGYASTYPPQILLLGSIRSIFVHVSRVVAPFGPSFPELNPSLVNFVSGMLREPMTYCAIGLVAVLGAAVLAFKRWPTVGFLSGFLIVTFSPLVRIDNIAGSISDNVILTQERWFYLPSVALIVGAALVCSVMWTRVKPGRSHVVTGLLGVAALAGLGYEAGLHARRLDDPFAQLRRLYLFPEERLSRMERANKLMLYAQWVALPSGEREEAERRARAALDVIPDSPITAVALGGVLAALQKWAEVVRVVEPWMDPAPDVMRQYATTNPRVGDDLNRVSDRIPFLLASAYGRLEMPGPSSEYFCAAVQRGVDLQLLNRTWRDIFGDQQLTCEISVIGR